MVQIVLDGRKDAEEYFRLSGVLEREILDHTPLLTFIVSEDAVTVRILCRALDALSLPDETPVMGQWVGQWRSDFFQFTVGQLRQYLEAKDELLKSARNVVKRAGPKGGFQSLSYEYTNEDGTKSFYSTGSKAMAERLEAIFARCGIPVTLEKPR